MAEPRVGRAAEGPAYYARRGGFFADCWTLLHPPYTLWHLGYVVLGAGLATHLHWDALAASVLAFLLAVGVAAHALDERTGHPLGTAFSDRALAVAAGVALTIATLLGFYGAFLWAGVNWPLALALPVGVALVLGYNLELAAGRMHSDLTFALGWGGFPLVVGYLAQFPGVSAAGVAGVVLACGAAVALTYAQRRLSTPARDLRRRTVEASGTVTRRDGSRTDLDVPTLLAPLEGALRALSWAVPLVAVATLVAHV
jgi:hypothetical protein